MAIRRMAQRRGTEAEWLEIDPILFEGEFGFVSDANQLVVGDGVSRFSERPRFEFSGVSSVNGQLGTVTITASDIGAAEDGDVDQVQTNLGNHLNSFNQHHGSDHDARNHSFVLSGATIGDLGGADADEVDYDNSSSSLSATNVQAAIDELDDETVKNFGGGLHQFHDNGNSGANATINLANGNVHRITLTNNTPSLTFSGATSGAGCEFTLIAHQDDTGNRTIDWVSNVLWPASGSTPAEPSLDPNSINIYKFLTVNGGTTWYGRALGFDFE